MPSKYAIGLDYGTNSVRALIVDVRTGVELAAIMFDYPSGTAGILLDPRDPNLARQNPQDYLDGLEASIRGALEKAAARDDFDPADVIGIGVDTTGSTPIPVDADGRPLAFEPRFSDNLYAKVWLWKDDTAGDDAYNASERAGTLTEEWADRLGLSPGIPEPITDRKARKSRGKLEPS